MLGEPSHDLIEEKNVQFRFSFQFEISTITNCHSLLYDGSKFIYIGSNFEMEL